MKFIIIIVIILNFIVFSFQMKGIFWMTLIFGHVFVTLAGKNYTTVLFTDGLKSIMNLLPCFPLCNPHIGKREFGLFTNKETSLPLQDGKQSWKARNKLHRKFHHWFEDRLVSSPRQQQTSADDYERKFLRLTPLEKRYHSPRAE